MKITPSLLILLLIVFGCNRSNNEDLDPTLDTSEMYFPPINSNIWETTTVDYWNADKLEELHLFLEENNSKSLMILVNGRIAVESYYNGHHADATWQWNSAGKTLVTATVGLAAQQGYLNIQNPVSDYLGTAWTSTTIEQESLITPFHLLSMTSGLNDETNLVTKANMSYLADAETRWSYSNVFQKLIDVVDESTQQDFRTYFDEQLAQKIGMTGTWNYGLLFKIFHSNTRSMARFGLLALNQGTWNEEEILNQSFFNASTTTSQNLNPSYGYLWWLNGKESYRVPGSQQVFQTSLIPNAPADCYAAMGASEQRIYVVPSKNMVIVRMGETSNSGATEFAVSSFDNLFWEQLNAVWE